MAEEYSSSVKDTLEFFNVLTENSDRELQGGLLGIWLFIVTLGQFFEIIDSPAPSMAPSRVPSAMPSQRPTSPTIQPSQLPTGPTSQPSIAPSMSPTIEPNIVLKGLLCLKSIFDAIDDFFDGSFFQIAVAPAPSPTRL